MSDAIICFLGCGNMGRSLIGGLAADNFPLENIHAVDTNATQLDQLRAQIPVLTSTTPEDAVPQADVVVLAVKPQIMQQVAESISGLLSTNTVVVSIAAGINCDSLERWLGREKAIVRVMPNTPSLVGSGAAALFANKNVNEQQASHAETILRAVGITLWLQDEGQMDAVTAVSGSGPAYFFLMMEAMQDAAEALGLSSEQAHLLVLQTAYGAAKMALESNNDAATLRQQVTSPGGTTEQAIKTLQEGQYEALIAKALHAAALRSKELAEQLGKEK